MELLYFSDISQLDYVLASKPELLGRMRPITGDMVVSFELERLGIDFIDEWDLIEPEEIEKNWNDSYVLSRSWWDESIASTKYGIEPLTESAQHDTVYPFQACLNARTAYNRLFSTFSVEKINGFFLPEVAVIRTGPAPTNRAVRSLAQAVLFFSAEKRGITVEKLNSSYPLSLGITRGFWNGITNRLKSGKTHSAEKGTRRIVLVHKDGLRASEYAAITESLGKLSDVKMISFSQQELEIGAKFKNMGCEVESRLQSFWNKYVEYSGGYEGEYPEIFANTHLQFQFDRIKSEMETAANYGDIFAALLDTLKPSVVIFGFESLTIERVLVGLAQARKIYTLGMLHGGVIPKMAIRGVAGRAEAVMVWNDFDVQVISSYGADPSSLKKIGCIQYEDDYFQYVKKFRTHYSSDIKPFAKKRLGFDANKPVIMLVTAEINTGFAAAVANPRKHRDVIRELIALVAARLDLQFVIKPHPSYDYYELYRRLLDSKMPNLKFLEQATLSEIIEASDICLMINYCTTASLEAILHLVPVVYLNNAVYPLNDWRDNLSENGIRRVNTTVELEKTIDRLLTNPVARQHALSDADKQIKEILGVEEIPAGQRFTNFIRQVLDGKQEVGFRGLSGAQAMYDLLYADHAKQAAINLAELSKMHSMEELIYVLSYIAGLHNLGSRSLERIFELLHDDVQNETLAEWRIARWPMHQAYITGQFNNPIHGRGFSSKLGSLLPYFIYPHKFFAAPAVFKRVVVKHLAANVLGGKMFDVIHFIHHSRKKYFGFVR